QHIDISAKHFRPRRAHAWIVRHGDAVDSWSSEVVISIRSQFCVGIRSAHKRPGADDDGSWLADRSFQELKNKRRTVFESDVNRQITRGGNCLDVREYWTDGGAHQIGKDVRDRCGVDRRAVLKFHSGPQSD